MIAISTGVGITSNSLLWASRQTPAKPYSGAPLNVGLAALSHIVGRYLGYGSAAAFPWLWDRWWIST